MDKVKPGSTAATSEPLVSDRNTAPRATSDSGGTGGTSKARPAAGDGIRSIRTTSVFQVLNFELYTKPNMVVMVFGVVAITLSTAYLAYLKAQMSGTKTYVAIAEDGKESLMTKTSKWN